jgi:hypothetical protein
MAVAGRWGAACVAARIVYRMNEYSAIQTDAPPPSPGLVSDAIHHRQSVALPMAAAYGIRIYIKKLRTSEGLYQIYGSGLIRPNALRLETVTA